MTFQWPSWVHPLPFPFPELHNIQSCLKLSCTILHDNNIYVDIEGSREWLLHHVLLHSRVSLNTPLECSRTCRPSLVSGLVHSRSGDDPLMCDYTQPTDWTEYLGRCDSTTTCTLVSVQVLVCWCTGGAPTIARTGHPPATTHIQYMLLVEYIVIYKYLE